MLTIKGTELDEFPVSGLKRVRDLMWLDGPLLVEYVHPKGDHFLYCWTDCDAAATRWMILRVAEQSILRLAHAIIPLDFVITKACQDDFVYFLDVWASSTRKPSKTTLSRISDVPTEYLPKKGVFLDESEPAGDGQYTVLLDGGWNATDLFLLPKSFEQTYSFLHAHLQLQVPTLEKLPWRGGFSSVHFDSWVRRTIPSQDRLGVNKMMVASPGFIKFTGDDATAESVAKCVISMSENLEAKKAYDELTDFIKKSIPREANLSTLDWPHLDLSLIEMTTRLAVALGVVDAKRLLQSVKTPFEAAQILRWFVRRIRPLVEFQRAGRLNFLLERDD